jgi:hypothetical protein
MDKVKNVIADCTDLMEQKGLAAYAAFLTADFNSIDYKLKG